MNPLHLSFVRHFQVCSKNGGMAACVVHVCIRWLPATRYSLSGWRQQQGTRELSRVSWKRGRGGRDTAWTAVVGCGCPSPAPSFFLFYPCYLRMLLAASPAVVQAMWVCEWEPVHRNEATRRVSGCGCFKVLTAWNLAGPLAMRHIPPRRTSIGRRSCMRGCIARRGG